jgi:hypothetical protein
MNLKTELAKIHLNHLILQITDVLLSHSLREFYRNKINYIKLVKSTRGYADNFIVAMDAHWQQSKVCDVRVTLSGLWTLVGSGAKL